MEKSIIKIVNQRNALLRNLGEIKKTLEVNPSSARELSKKAKEIINQLDEIEKLLRENATFQSEEFALFIRRVFVLTEDKTSITKLTNRNTNEPIFILSDETTKDFIFEEINTEKDLEKFLKKQPENIIVLQGEQTYPFKENSKMENQFAKHKRLRIAIYDLIQLKLSNPNISDEERYKEALNTILRDNLRQSYLFSNKKAQQ